MNDQELLTYAAKAAEIEVWPHGNRKISKDLIFATKNGNWNPLTNDADAFQLMVKLCLEVYVHENDVAVIDGNIIANTIQNHNGNPYSATRRAIVMAAAEIGKEK